MDKKYILGISALYHNSAAALICDGEIVAAAEEERFTRKKADPSFPINAICFCLDKAGIYPEELYRIAFYENPVEKFGRIITSELLTTPKSAEQFLFAVPEWVTDKVWIEKTIKKELNCKKVKTEVYSHHLSHAASAFYPSPFEDAAIITFDGVGEWDTMSYGTGNGNEIKLIDSLRFPNSLGLLYSAFTLYTGFKINNGEYKMMGLAPYGQPVYEDLIKEKLIRISDDGSFTVNQEYFSYTHGIRTINKRFSKLFGRPGRKPDEEITQFYADIASSIQCVTNDVLMKTAKHVREVTGKSKLCMAGGVALNVTSTGLVRQSGIFDDIWIQPAAGDAGCAIGAAYEAYYRSTENERIPSDDDKMKGCYLGSCIQNSSSEDDEALKKLGGVWTCFEDKTLCEKTASLVNDGYVVGLARGNAEFGPRALGNRSILADARKSDMLQTLNKKIKFREGFRPFAPAVIEEDASEYFDINGKSPYMNFTFPLKKDRRIVGERGKTITETASLKRSDIPAVTHIDYSARIQTVSEKTNPFFYGVLSEFKKLTGCSVMINTSYNTSKEPIVNNAVDAYRCFMRSGMDYAVIGSRLFDKKNQKGIAPKGGW